MVGYRRNVVAGGSYFITVTLADHSSRLLVDRIDDLREAFRTVRVQRPFALDAVVIWPDHLHCIWTLPPGRVTRTKPFAGVISNRDFHALQPVKHGYVSRVSDWQPYSSFHRKVREGNYLPEWAGGDDVEENFGE